MVNDRPEPQLPLRKKVKSILLPFLQTTDRQLDYLVVFKYSFPGDMQQIYDQVAATRKWRYCKVKKRYKQLSAKVEEHNAAVRPILLELDGISISKLHDSASTIPTGTFIHLQTLLDKVGSYIVTETNPYKSKIDGLRFFVDRIADFQEQCPLWHELKSIAEEIASEGSYIYRPRQEELLGRENLAKERIAKIKEPLYGFDSVQPVAHLLKIHNTVYLSKLTSDKIFDDIGGTSLDMQQRIAAVTPEKTALVIAGAGSGKTTTICGRVKYLIERQNVNPEDILLLSYSKKSADDLAERIAKISPSATVGTFHKTGLDILKAKTNSKFVVEEQWDAIIEEYFREEMSKNPESLRKVLTYYGLFLNNGETSKKYENEGALYEDLKKDDFITFKTSLLNLSDDRQAKITIKKERVKSFEELAIANFYFINGVDYEYERPYEYDESTPERRQYTPDFYLKQNGIYHEHFGIDASGRARQYCGKAESDYLAGITWKRECHLNHGTHLIETCSADFADGTLFEKLTASLKEAGVEMHPIGEDVIRETLESVYDGQSFKSFVNLVKTFLSLYKARYENSSAFASLKETVFQSNYAQKRLELFLSICKDVYAFYTERIRSEGKIDFDDMILQSTKALSEIESFRYKHVIVDEFQGISYSRAQFLKAIIAHGQASLFAVGDDWQSIYRFSGSDMNIFLSFEEYFGYTERYFIENVHRNSQQLQDAMTKFIEKNPEQIHKQIHSDKHLEHPIIAIYYQNDESVALSQALELIAKKNREASVLLLGRNNKDITPYLSHRFFFDKGGTALRSLDYPKLTISYSTVHGSKGLEEDFVILLSASDSPNGFPNKTEDDPLLNLVMSAPSAYPFAEERRLWYVALTRTRSHTFVLAPADNSSCFLWDMKGDFFEVNPSAKPTSKSRIGCPRCQGGHLVRREKDGHQFYGCSNYPYCDYTIDDFRAVENGRRCPVCGDVLVLKKGRWGMFYGCHNYPRCIYKMKPEITDPLLDLHERGE